MGSHVTRSLILFIVLVLAPAIGETQPTTTRVSVGPAGVQANGDSSESGVAISADGRWVAFGSRASNLVASDTNGSADVFVHDRQSAATVRASMGFTGAQLNGNSQDPAISANGRWIAFTSDATNAVAGDTNGVQDVFVRDLQLGTTTRVSVGPGGAQAGLASFRPAISADGRWVAFESEASNLVSGDTNGTFDVFVHDRQTATTTRVSVTSGGVQGNGPSYAPTISADGRWVAFHSWAVDLVSDDANGFADVFVHDQQARTTVRVSLSSGGVEGDDDSEVPAISADGRWVAFGSRATTLVAGDTNRAWDVFVHDRQTGTTRRASVGPSGLQANAGSYQPTISGDGRWVSFDSVASNLVPGDSNGAYDVFVHALSSGITARVSVGPSGTEGNGQSRGSPLAVSADGRFVAYWSEASNLVTGDTNAYADIFVHDRGVDQAPIDLVARAIAGNLVTLRWRVPAGAVPATGFVLEGGLNPGDVAASIPTGSANPTFTFTAPTGSFYVRVHALNGTVRSAASNEIQIHVNVPVRPSAPANLLGLVNGSTVALAWVNTFHGGAPASLILDVTGAVTTSLPLGFGESFTFAGVPSGTYTLTLRAQNAGGSSLPSNAVTVTFPGSCSGAPLTPANLFAYRLGTTLFVDWTPAASGPAPTGYRLNVTGSFVGSLATGARALSGSVGSGSYTLSVLATNACGESPGTTPQTIVVP